MKIPGIKGIILNNRFLSNIIKPGKFVKDFLVGIYVYSRYQSSPPSTGGKSVCLAIKNNVYTRYLYLLVKFFHLQGYHVFIKAYPVTLRYICHFDQSFLIIKEKLATFYLRLLPGCQLYLSDAGQTPNLSADYFSDLMLGPPRENVYRIPMSMHPRMYHNGWWNEPYTEGRRHRSVFFSGNANRDHYTIAEKDNVFGVIDRVRLYDLLVQQPRTFVPKSLDELEAQSTDHQVVLVTKQNFTVPMPRLRQVLANYSFFLACPGYIMPFSHNVIEAMSVGTVPIIQSNYAKLFHPPLEHGITALLFDDEQSLEEQIDQALGLSPETIARLSQNVLSYYEQHLTPEVVVNNLMKQQYDQFYLMAEAHSVELLKKSLKQPSYKRPVSLASLPGTYLALAPEFFDLSVGLECLVL